MTTYYLRLTPMAFNLLWTGVVEADHTLDSTIVALAKCGITPPADATELIVRVDKTRGDYWYDITTEDPDAAPQG